MSSAAAYQRAPSRRLAIPRLIATLALFVVSASVFCALAGFVLVRQADDRMEAERRNGLIAAIDEMRSFGADVGEFDLKAIRALERSAGLKDLRYEIEPVSTNREVHAALDRQGRIAGWFTWERDRPMTQAFGRLGPLLAVTVAVLIAFCGFAGWQVRKAMQALAASERRAWQLAHEDELTGLANHRKSIQTLEERLVARPPTQVMALAFLDIDGLGDINDAYGQAVGDTLLAAWSARLRDSLPAAAALGRFDGDQFAATFASADAERIEADLRLVSGTLARPFWIGGQAIEVGVTIGYSHAPAHGQTRDELVRRADLALRAAKRKNRGGITAFDASMDSEFDERRFIERELRRALNERRLDVHYQPIVSADGERVTGVEALLRWTHPDRGPIAPSTFVAAAERSGLMAQLGEFVLRRALADAARWPALYVSVNLSPVQVRDRALVELVADTMRDTGIAPSRVVLEVTEGVLIDNPDEAASRLAALHGLGVKLALDDFGTGYSSFAYLQRFRFDKLKIDKSFVDPIGRSAEAQAMLQAIVALGRALGLTLLAEGVETEEQRVLLRLCGCSEMQGYLFARPGSREAVDRLLAEQQPKTGAASVA